MANYSNFLKEVLNKKQNLVNARSGNDFEENIKSILKHNGFSQSLLKNDAVLAKFISSIKPIINKKSGNNLVRNNLYQLTKDIQYSNCFIWQPYGSQNFPDFLVLTENHIFSMEIKFSKKNQSSPMWNSNLPKTSSLYIFGRFEQGDLTIFRGEDILPDNERSLLISIWDRLDKVYDEWEKEFKKAISKETIKNTFGFRPYIRKAYEQGKVYNEEAINDFFNNSTRQALEEKAIEYVETLENS